MRVHIVTVGKPKLAFAREGWDEYLKRLTHYHEIRVTHLPDKWAYDANQLRAAAGSAYTVALVIDGEQLSSQRLADFLQKRAMDGREVCFIIGGPEGLPDAVIEAADFRWSFSHLTFPHDLAMVILLEALYRASTINAGLPYHK
jgi:23S rRNA (pseudouridine1915-N3)-methyltransferase